MLQRSVFNNKNGEKNVWSFKNSKLSCFYTRYLLHLLHWMVYNVGTPMLFLLGLYIWWRANVWQVSERWPLMSDLISSIALKRSALPPPARRLNKYNTFILHDSHYTGPLLKTSFLADQFTIGVRGNASVGNLKFLNVRNACFWHSDRFLVDSLHYSQTDTITAKLEGIFGRPSSTPNIFSLPPPSPPWNMNSSFWN